MEVRKGYKQTEVGIIPEDWEVAPVGEAYEICNNLRLPINRTVRKQMEGQYPYYGPTSIQGYINEYRIEGEYALIGEDGDHFLKWQEQSMTLLVHGRFNVNNHAHLIKGTKNLTAWFYYYFSHLDITPYLTRQGAGRYKLNKRTLMGIPCVLPPTLAEQEAIAEALSDADALIEAVEQLLAKKCQVKQGAMSELLTEKRRLAGFSGEWEVREIGDLGFDISDGNYSGMYPKQSDFKAIGVPFIRANNIKGMKVIDDDMRFISTDKHNELLKGHLKKDDILITTRGELGNIALVPDMHIGSNINAQIVRINTRKAVNHIYLAFYLSYEDVQNKIKGAETGSALKQLPVGKLVKIPVVLPPLPEQTAIAEILSDMDAEISALEEKLVKARQVKAGMMSELLTGRIRLIDKRG